MTKPLRSALFATLALALGASSGALAQGAPAAQPVELGKFNAWTAYSAPAKNGKVCYALSQPSARKPGGLNRDPAYLFISNRPRENVRNEVSVIIGFRAKADSKVEVAIPRAGSFELYAREDGAFAQSVEDEAKLVRAMRGAGGNMTLKTTSARGNVTTDTYSLAGISAALDRIDRECK
ncbi:invasion associated locus B family protein [Methylopila musalis]|uniref:Invasion associated locus B family protein n=1 Tax=Methylopila musalis TaxID=1134781 RepID=A0ABW3Z471_9HYPH